MPASIQFQRELSIQNSVKRVIGSFSIIVNRFVWVAHCANTDFASDAFFRSKRSYTARSPINTIIVVFFEIAGRGDAHDPHTVEASTLFAYLLPIARRIEKTNIQILLEKPDEILNCQTGTDLQALAVCGPANSVLLVAVG
jgi:hypothetical protein